MKLRLVFVHLILLGLFTGIMWSMFTWYSTMTEFTGRDFQFGAPVISYDPTVVQGESFNITRKSISEPQGCTFRVDRYLIPLSDVAVELYIGSFERRSIPKDTILNLKAAVPLSIPPGKYLYVAKGKYYCSWLNHAFAPFRVQGIPIPIEVLPAKIFE